MDLISEPLLFVLALIDTGSVLFLLVYFFYCAVAKGLINHKAAELILNSNILQWVASKLIAHSFLEFLLLIHGQLILCLVNLPMTLWLIYEYFGVPSGNMGVYDPTEIHNRGQLRRHTKDCMIYLGYYLIFFFIYLYCMIIALLKGDPINRNEDGMMHTD